MIDDARLLAFAVGDDDSAEEHVMSCTRCADRVATFLRIGPALATLVRGGAMSMPITPSLLVQLEAAGLISRRYVLAPGTTVPCTVGATDRYSLARFEADFTGVTRIDLVTPLQRLDDVPFGDGIVLTVISGDYLRTLPTVTMPFSLVSVEPGGDRVLGTYGFAHTAYVPS